MVDLYCASYATPPAAVTLDIDDTVDVVHGHQQLSLFNAHYDERCFLPIHVYDTATGRPVAMMLRPGKTPSGQEIAAICAGWSGASAGIGRQTRITIRGDGHYGRPEVMDWCDENGIDFVFGLPGNTALDRAVDDRRRRHPHPPRARRRTPCLRGFAETHLSGQVLDGADRRACARIEATTLRPRHPLRRHQPRHRLG